MLRNFVQCSKRLDLFRRSIVGRSDGFASNSSGDDKENILQKINRKLDGLFVQPPEDNDISDLPFGLQEQNIPEHADVVIVGGGAMGSSTAYWLKTKLPRDMNVVVVERDPTYKKASTTLSVGGLRQQFSLEENIRMSLFGADFIRNVNRHLGIPEFPPVDVSFRPYGYLLLASEEGAADLTQNSQLQNSLGAKNMLLTSSKLKDLFPWISTDGIALGCLGLEKEGWFDPWALLCAFKTKSLTLGVNFIQAEAAGMKFRKQIADDQDSMDIADSLIVRVPSGDEREIKFSYLVIAAGAFSQKIAKMANIGLGEDLLEAALPVEPRKRFVYCFHCPEGPGLNTPLTIDPSGTYFRRENLTGNFICGRSPEPDEEPAPEDLSCVDHEYFDEKVWPVLARRVKAFEKLKVNSAWAGFYEFNTFDANGVVGPHPHHQNIMFATGFSGHGIQHSPAVGRAVAELILSNQYDTIDLSRLGFHRFLEKEPLTEVNIV